jgi:hypothetical protein
LAIVAPLLAIIATAAILAPVIASVIAVIAPVVAAISPPAHARFPGHRTSVSPNYVHLHNLQFQKFRWPIPYALIA